MLTTIKTVLANIGKGPATSKYPFVDEKVPKGFRGRVTYDPTKCIGCKTCVHVCAGKAVKVEEREDSFDFMVWDGTCTRCQMCENFCPTGAIKVIEDYHTAFPVEETYQRVRYGNIPYIRCTECNKTIKPLPEIVYQEKLKGENIAYKERSHICPDCRRKMMAKDLHKGLAL